MHLLNNLSNYVHSSESNFPYAKTSDMGQELRGIVVSELTIAASISEADLWQICFKSFEIIY